MRINEAAEQLGLSQRALKYYEKEGLLEVRRDENGYRNYSAQDLERLKKNIAVPQAGNCDQRY